MKISHILWVFLMVIQNTKVAKLGVLKDLYDCITIDKFYRNSSIRRIVINELNHNMIKNARDKYNVRYK